jgi:hypothetical protein
MKYHLALLASGALVLMAADVWNAKPYTDWNDKDVQKIMTDSPWAKKTSVMGTEGPAPPPMGGASGGGGRGGRGGGGGGGSDDSAPDPISSHGPASGGGAPAMGGAPSAQAIVCWPVSLPIKQAIAKAKYGKEVATSPEAKQSLEREEPYYVIEVSQFPFRGRTGDDFKEALTKSAVLSVKGKDSIHAMEVQVNPRGRTLDLFFVFPRQRVFTVEDSEIDFSAKAGEVPIKQKFKLKEMVFNGKLEL